MKTEYSPQQKIALGIYLGRMESTNSVNRFDKKYILFGKFLKYLDIS